MYQQQYWSYALHALLVWSTPARSPNSRPTTLSEFSGAQNDTRFALELERLQEALISPDNNWQGRELLNSLRDIRRKIKMQELVQSRSHLAPLNP